MYGAHQPILYPVSGKATPHHYLGPTTIAHRFTQFDVNHVISRNTFSFFFTIVILMCRNSARINKRIVNKNTKSIKHAISHNHKTKFGILSKRWIKDIKWERQEKHNCVGKSYSTKQHKALSRTANNFLHNHVTAWNKKANGKCSQQETVHEEKESGIRVYIYIYIHIYLYLYLYPVTVVFFFDLELNILPGGTNVDRS